MITHEVIEKFFSGTCSKEELAAINAYLNEHPHAVNDLLPEAEWNSFPEKGIISEQVSERLRLRIKSKFAGNPTSYRRLIRIVAAACLLLIFGLGFIYLITGKKTSHKISDNASALQTIVNNTHRAKSVFLPDSSLVEIYPGGTVQFATNFEQQERRVMMSGVALFKVRRDVYRPFRVFTDSIVTTVLGTEFTIFARPDSNKLSVSLHKGKVTVQHLRHRMGDTTVRYTLNPGDVFEFDKNTKRSIVYQANRSGLIPETKKAKKDNLRQSGIDGRSWYVFNNQPLTQVFDYLQQLYNVKISYVPAELTGMTFVARIDRSDSLKNILHSIVLLNNLDLEVRENEYLIRKKR